MSNPFKKRYSGESAKHLRVLWDYFLCGQNMHKVLYRYNDDPNPPTRSYATLAKWKEKFNFDNRILEYQESLIEQDRVKFENERQKWTMKQIELLEKHNDAINDADVDVEMVSLNQYTNAINTQIKMIQSVFNIEPVTKIAPTDPSGKEPYKCDVSELLKLADAAKRRPQ